MKTYLLARTCDMLIRQGFHVVIIEGPMSQDRLQVMPGLTGTKQVPDPLKKEKG